MKNFNQMSNLIFGLMFLLIFSITPQLAYAVDLATGANATWASAAGQTSADVANAVAGDNVDITGAATLTVTNDATANDGSGLNTFNLGDITNSAGAGNVNIVNGSANALTTTINSANITGTFNATNSDAQNQSSTTTVTNDLTTGGNVVINNTETSANQAVQLTVGGDLNATGNINITGNTGAGGGANSQLIFNGSNLSAAAINLDRNTGSAILQMNGTTQSVTGVISGAGAGEGNVTLSATSTTTFNNNIGGTQIRQFGVNAGGRAIFKAGTLSTTTLTNSGELQFDTTVTGTGTTWELGGTAQAGITLGASSYTGNTVLNATAVTNVNASNAITVTPHSEFTSGTLTLIDGPGTGAGSADNAALYNVTPNGLIDYTVAIANVDDVTLTADLKSSSQVSEELGLSGESGEVLTNAFTGSASDAEANAAIFNSTTSAGSTTNNTVEQLSPDPGQSAVNVASAVALGMTDLVGTQLASGRSGASGISTGDDTDHNSFWARPFYTLGNQDSRDGVAGYDFWSTGFAIGLDRSIDDEERSHAGLMFGYAYSDVDGDGIAQRDSGTHSFLFGLYGDYAWDAFFIEMMAGYTLNDVDAERTITFGGLARKAESDYLAHQFTARTNIGMEHQLSERQFITPSLGFILDFINPESYTETGAGALNLTVDPDTEVSAIGLLGLTYQYHGQIKSARVLTELRSNLSYDFASDESKTTAQFSGGGNTFSTTGADVAEFGATFGGSFIFICPKGTGYMSLGYDYEVKSDYNAHVIHAKFKKTF